MLTAHARGEPDLALRLISVVEGEGVGITQALVDGLDRNALTPGTPVVMRANPNRGGWGKQVRIMDVTLLRTAKCIPFMRPTPGHAC